MRLRLVPWVFLLTLGVGWAAAVFALLMLVFPPVAAAGPPPEYLPQVVVVVERVPAGPRRWTPDDVHEALRTASPLARCVVTAEIGGVGFDPLSIGAAGELGPVQLHPFGKLRSFFMAGYSDPFSPYQSLAYLEEAIARGEGRAWSPILLGMCE